MRKIWTEEELIRLNQLSKEFPPTIIAQKLKRSETSVRRKMREMKLKYISQQDYRKSKIQRLLSEDLTEIRKNDTKNDIIQLSRPSKLDEFWKTLILYARIAKNKNKNIDVLSFIKVYRKIGNEYLLGENTQNISSNK